MGAGAGVAGEADSVVGKRSGDHQTLTMGWNNSMMDADDTAIHGPLDGPEPEWIQLPAPLFRVAYERRLWDSPYHPAMRLQREILEKQFGKVTVTVNETHITFESVP